ncbi:hypothetical protein C8F04DRAFT_1104573 [Mycena alexandri]|uniref:Uncharacterized protein n=1 Tax=Mycena alexandri TaxID=1745969 RepID=A0AAD6SSS2_9AGAR|nr:hypothetical protein C8F04DRAFT_1104573 [Mycena alexandri]
MMPKDMHGYRTTGFGVPNWKAILHAHCSLPKTPVPPIQLLSPKFNGDLLALRAWRDIYLNDIYSAAIDALGLVEDPAAGSKLFLIIYLRPSPIPGISEMLDVENAFVFSLEEAAIMLDESVWKAVQLVVNGRPQTETHEATEPAPCVFCQIIDPIDPRQAPSFTVPVKVTDTLLNGARRPYSWKEHLVESVGGTELRENLIAVAEGVLH